MIVYIAQSLDGYIADQNDSLEWLDNYAAELITAKDELKNSYPNFIKDIDVVVYGKKTYNFLKNLGIDNPYAEYENYLITNNQVDDQTITKQLTMDDFKQLDFSNKKVWVVGGGSIIAQLMDDDMVNQLTITTMPIILGGGPKLFSTTTQSKWRLTNVQHDLDFIETTYVRSSDAWS